MFKEIGIMQGRLLPKYKGRYQAHPVGYWEDEFFIAKNLDLNYIEFILDYNNYEHNPLTFDKGINKISNIIQKTSVGVKSICADYFMEAPLHSSLKIVSEKSITILNKLIINANKIGVSDIVIPCVDQSSLINEIDKKRLINNLNKSIELAYKYNINLALETDLHPQKFLDLLNEFDSKQITVNYDIGNSASLGYDIFEEFECYGERISDIHIKDREFGGGSVFLGSGSANFSLFYKNFSSINFDGPIIMQAYRDDEGIEIFKKQLNWLKKSYNSYDCTYSS